MSVVFPVCLAPNKSTLLFRFKECRIFSSSSLGMYFIGSILGENGALVNKILWSRPAISAAIGRLVLELAVVFVLKKAAARELCFSHR